MERKITEALDALHMNVGCVQTIQQAMSKKAKASSPVRPLLRIAAACCLALALLCLIHPGIAQALEDTAEKTIEWFRSTVKRGHGVTVLEEDYVYYNDGHMEIEVFEGSSADTPHDSTLAPYPAWLKESDGRVYFLANMENRDITDCFSQEEPFLYTYEKDGIIHYIAIGGSYDPEEGLDSVGYSEWLRRGDHTEFEGWLGGSGAGQYDPQTDDYALWYARAIVELDIPWDNTEAKQQLEETE